MFLIQTQLSANCHPACLLSVKAKPFGRPCGGLARQVKTGKTGEDFVILGRVALQAYRTAAGLSSTGSSVVGKPGNKRCHCRRWAIRYCLLRTVPRNVGR